MVDLIDNLKLEKRSLLLTKTEVKWFTIQIPNEPTITESFKNYNVINKLRDYGRQVYEQDISNYETFREKTRRSDHTWIKQVLKSGTTADKINANCILMQDSAIHNMKSLDCLIAMVKVNKKRECLLAIDALKDLFTTYLLPNRTLKNFNEHAFDQLKAMSNDDKEVLDRIVLIWYFESLLKSKYIQFLKSIQEVFHDTIPATKIKLSSTITDLLIANRCEQEKFLLEILINKLGDPDYEVASKILYQLKKLLTKRPKKKLDILLELERLVTRQNITDKAQYYGLCSMNQILLTKQDTDAANRLIVVYFSFFKKFIKNKEIDSRMLNAILTGVNRAYKYAKMDNEEIDNNLNTLFKLIHVTTFNVSIQALMFLNQIIDSREDMLHRYYNALYRKMFDLEIRNTSKQKYFLNLLFNSINKDDAIPRIKAFVKRLLQISLNQNVPFISGALMLLSELARSKKNIFQFENSLLMTSHNALTNDNDDEDEKFVDVKTESSDDEAEKKEDTEDKPPVKNGKTSSTAASWVHKRNIIHKCHDKYDYMQRNPLYSGADKTLTYELMLYSRHYHPTVSLFANRLINDEYIDYSGDPLEDFSLMHFLDRFVYKNPKKTIENKKKKDIFGPKHLKSKLSHINSIPVNSKEYINKDYKEIPADEKFFYEYFKKQADKKGNLEGDIDSEAGSISDTEFDEFLAKTEDDGGVNNEEWTLDVTDALKKETNKAGKLKNKKRGSASDEDDVELDDSDDDENGEDDEDLVDEEFDDDDEFESAMNEEGEEIDDDEDDEDEDEEAFNDVFVDKAPTKKGKKSSKLPKDDIGSLFASAEEFSDLLSESANYEAKGVGSLSNQDNADVKQLKWEMSRMPDRRHKGRKNGFSKNGQKKKNFSSKNTKKTMLSKPKNKKQVTKNNNNKKKSRNNK